MRIDRAMPDTAANGLFKEAFPYATAFPGVNATRRTVASFPKFQGSCNGILVSIARLQRRDVTATSGCAPGTAWQCSTWLQRWSSGRIGQWSYG